MFHHRGHRGHRAGPERLGSAQSEFLSHPTSVFSVPSVVEKLTSKKHRHV